MHLNVALTRKAARNILAHVKSQNTETVILSLETLNKQIMQIKSLKTYVKCNKLSLTQVQIEKLVFSQFIFFLYTNLLNKASLKQ